jgi:transcriptional regulator of acetoin/glycerol metabolism
MKHSESAISGSMANSFRNIPGMHEAIKRSRARSVRFGVDPSQDGAPEASRLSDEQLRERIDGQKEFYALARDQLDSLYRLLKDTGFCMALADPEGYILYVIGDPELIEHFKRRRCLPGYRWTERDIGTCAIGFVLEEKIPVFLPGDLMYSTLVRDISNAGAPVFSPDGALIGVIILSGSSQMMHVHTLGLVRQAAETVTSQIRERERTRELAIKHQYMMALLESDSQGMVTVDQEGRIVQANKKARAILHLPLNYEGKPFKDFLGNNLDLRKQVQSGKRFQAMEIPTMQAGVSHYASLDPIRLENGELVGGLFSLTEKKEMMRMAVKVTGYNAHFTFDSIVGSSPALKDVMHRARIAADSTAPVLLCGETGTGKELFAQAIHNAGERKDRPFVAINCGAIPKELIESELFGYEEGAFTGAQKGGRLGKIELADSGTLFLDEIGDMPIDMQVKLLRVLQSGELQRVGGLRTVRVDLRVISATNKDLGQCIVAHKFRADLFYRISTLTLTIPALRNRVEDIIPLALHFIQRHEVNLNRVALPLPSETVEALKLYPWPGNIRQLESAIECAMHLAEGGKLLPEHLGINKGLKDSFIKSEEHIPGQLLRLDRIEKNAIVEAFDHLNGNIRQIAVTLGISRPTLYRKLKKYGLLE